MPEQSATANQDNELTSIKITGAICKILSPDKSSIETCNVLEEKALFGEISIQEQEIQSKSMLKNKGINV